MANKSRLKQFLLIGACCGALIQVSPAHSQDQQGVLAPELSLSTVILFAMDDNPDLLMARERVEQMDDFADEARSDYYPQIVFNAEGGREYIKPTGGDNVNNMGKANVLVSQKLFNGFATSSEVNRREELKNSMEFDSVKQKEKVLLDTTGFYLDILRFQNEVETVERFVGELDSIVETISAMYEAGDISKTMFDYAMSRQASAYADLSEVKSSFNDAVSNLEFLTGPLPDFRATKPDMLRPERFEMDLYYDMAREHNTEVQKNLSEMEAMRYQLDSERAAYYPEVNFNVKAEQTHNDGGEVGPGRNLKAAVNLSYNIFDGFNRKHRTSRVKSQIKELEYKDDKIVKQLKKDIQLAYNQILAFQDSMKAVDHEIRANLAVKALNR